MVLFAVLKEYYTREKPYIQSRAFLTLYNTSSHPANLGNCCQNIQTCVRAI